MSILLFADNAASQLASGITNVALTANLTAGSGSLFPAPGAGEYFKATFVDAATGTVFEIVHVTAVVGDTITMVRAQEGTSAHAWLAGDSFFMAPTAGTMQALVQTEQLQNGKYSTAVAGGTVNAIIATLPSTLTSLVDGMAFTVIATGPNTTATTLALTLGTTLQTTHAIVKFNNIALSANDVPATGYPMRLVYSAAFNAYVMQNPATANVQPQIAGITSSVASNALTVVYGGGTLDFRNTSLGNGAVTTLQVGSSSITVPSTATLGTLNGVAARLVVLLAYNAGTPVLCITNLTGGLQLDETNTVSPTTISSGATSNAVVYSASAVASNSPYRVVGFVDVTETTAGTWSASATLVQGVGGQALTALSSLGYGQTHQDLTASRSFGTTYYNTTGRPILVYVRITWVSGGGAVRVTVNGINYDGPVFSAVNQTSVVSVIVPPGGSYVMNGTNGIGFTLTAWNELR